MYAPLYEHLLLLNGDVNPYRRLWMVWTIEVTSIYLEVCPIVEAKRCVAQPCSPDEIISASKLLGSAYVFEDSIGTRRYRISPHPMWNVSNTLYGESSHMPKSRMVRDVSEPDILLGWTYSVACEFRCQSADFMTTLKQLLPQFRYRIVIGRDSSTNPYDMNIICDFRDAGDKANGIKPMLQALSQQCILLEEDGTSAAFTETAGRYAEYLLE